MENGVAFTEQNFEFLKFWRQIGGFDLIHG